MTNCASIPVPTGDLAKWRALDTLAKDIFWELRKAGKPENEALSAAVAGALIEAGI